jgi:AcrR family transcriptional regulator
MSDAGQEQDGRKRRAIRQRSRRRAEILAAARKVFSRKGYHASTIADILNEAGIARGTLYLYFPGKRALFEVLLDEMFTQIASAVRRIRTGPGEEPPLDQMYGNVRRVIGVLENNRDLTIILLREAVGLDSDFDQKLAAFYERLSGIIVGALRLGQEMGLVRPCQPELVSYCVLGSVKESVLHLLTSREAEALDREVVAREILDYNLFGLFVARR